MSKLNWIYDAAETENGTYTYFKYWDDINDRDLYRAVFANKSELYTTLGHFLTAKEAVDCCENNYEISNKTEETKVSNVTELIWAYDTQEKCWGTKTNNNWDQKYLIEVNQIGEFDVKIMDPNWINSDVKDPVWTKIQSCISLSDAKDWCKEHFEQNNKKELEWWFDFDHGRWSTDKEFGFRIRMNGNGHFISDEWDGDFWLTIGDYMSLEEAKNCCQQSYLQKQKAGF